MYPDPRDYAKEGLGVNSTYPNTQWLASDAVLLAGISSKLGDPLTPGLPSLDGIYRTAVKDIEDIPRILLQPISYGTARVLLEQAGGKCVCLYPIYSFSQDQECHNQIFVKNIFKKKDMNVLLKRFH